MGSRARPKRMTFSSGGRCPICKMDFKGGGCPHSITQAETYVEDQNLRATVRDELYRAQGIPPGVVDDVQDLLNRAHQYDAKPHLLYDGVRKLAGKYAKNQKMKENIQRLMDAASLRERRKDGDVRTEAGSVVGPQQE